MLDVFTAARPRPELADRFRVFEPLIGSWDLVVEYLGADGAVETTEDGAGFRVVQRFAATRRRR